MTAAGKNYRKGVSSTMLVKCKIIQPLRRTMQRFLNTLKLDLPSDSTLFLYTHKVMSACQKVTQLVTIDMQLT